MPNDIKDNTNLRPTYVQKPDIRFATTFLSNKYSSIFITSDSNPSRNKKFENFRKNFFEK